MPFPTATILTASTQIFVQRTLPNRVLPTIPVTVTAGAGSGATATAVLTGSVVTSVTVSAGGTLYTNALSVVFSGGGGTGASATAVLSAGVITSVTITSGGTGYSTAPTVAFVTTPGIGATSIPIAAILAPSGLTYGVNDTVIQQGDKLTFNSATPQTVVVAADVLAGATTLFVTVPLVAALQAGNVATSNGLLQILGGDATSFTVTEKDVSTKSFENGLFNDMRKTGIGGLIPFSGFYRAGDNAFDSVILPAALSANEVYVKLIRSDAKFRSGYAYVKGYSEDMKLEDICRFKFDFQLVGAFTFG